MKPKTVQGHTSHVWARCACGKEVQRLRWLYDQDPGRVTVCGACTPPDQPDRCTEGVWAERDDGYRGTVRCTQDVAHTGRCTP